MEMKLDSRPITLTDNERQQLLEEQLHTLATETDIYGDEWSKRMVAIENKLRAVYSDDNFRHLYFGIYDLIFRLREEEREVLMYNLTAMQEVVSKRPTESEHFKKCLKKLYDHLMLEISRIARLGNYNDIVNDYTDASKRFTEVKVEMQKQLFFAKEQMSQMNKKMDGFNSQSITVLSIFTGIVMAFFGGFTILGGAFNNINNQNNAKLFFMICLLGFVLFNTIFVFIYSASKISGKNISITCRHEKCEDCNECHVLFRAIKRYPYIVFVNAVIIIGMVVFFSAFPD